MNDRWSMFPVTMGQDQAFISFNESYAEQAQSEARNNHLRVEVAIKDPTEAGMPRGDEFKVLSRLDEALDAALTKLGGVYVGASRSISCRRKAAELSGEYDGWETSVEKAGR